MKDDLDRIRGMLDAIEKLDATSVQVASVGTALSDMASSLSAVAQAHERPPMWVDALVQALGNVRVQMPELNMPAPIVNVQPAAVTVQAPEVVIPPPAAGPQLVPIGWRMRVSKRDDLGRIAEMTLTPEN